MPLRAKKHEAIEKRLKMLLWGDPGVGKSTAAGSFPKSYIIDCERGFDHYPGLLAKSESVLFQTVDVDEVLAEVRGLSTEQHEYRTLVLDPVTTMEADLVEKAEKEFGAGDMRIWGRRDRTMRRLVNLLMNLDMNVIVTAHGKAEYAEGQTMVKIGKIFDAWKRLPYVFDLVLHLEKRGDKRMAIVKKTRLEGFRDGEEFPFSYEEIAKRYGIQAVERQSIPVAVVTAERAAHLKHLISLVTLPEGTVERWLSKANVETIEDLPAELAEKCITHIENMIAGKGEK